MAKLGRPKADQPKNRTVMIACRITEQLKKDVDKEAAKAAESLTDVVNTALQQYINRQKGYEKRRGA
jgi:predicted HicB family RNase H-like nuclease